LGHAQDAGKRFLSLPALEASRAAPANDNKSQKAQNRLAWAYNLKPKLVSIGFREKAPSGPHPSFSSLSMFMKAVLSGYC
jgi:hypothetical protein